MNSDQSAKDIFHRAIEHYEPHQWEGFIVNACGEDIAKRERVRELLDAHKQGDSFFDEKAAGNPPAVTERPGMQVGPYKLLQEIGEGGFGVVYMAEQQEPVRRKVAFKIIKPGMDTKQVIARFEAERQALAMMDHPNIAKVLDGGATESGRPYFVMELVRGVPITEFCDANKLSTRDRLDLFTTVCRAVQHAHQKGVIHRDIKPSNVMVTLHDNRPMPVIIDFGVSKAIGHQLTEKTLFTAYGQMVGTPTYMSPEQAQMNRMDIDTRSDIYSLGVVLYELLTGSTPLDAAQLRGTAYAEMQRLIREEEAPKPSTRVSTLGNALAQIAQDRGTDARRLGQFLRGDLDWIVMKALDKDRNRRYETANGLAADVERFLQNESVLACPPSTSYRIRKFASRNRSAVLIGGTIAAALMLAVVGLTVGYLRAEHAASDARLAWQNVSQEQKRTQQEKERAEQQRKLAEERQVVAESQKELAEQATEKALAAERKRTEALTDVYTTLGMAAAERKKKAEAMLWFANAAKIAPDPEREQFNRIRARSYSNDMLVPIAAFQHDATWVGDAEMDASNQFIMTRRLSEQHSNDVFDLGPISIFHIHTSQVLPLPEAWLPLKAATWSPDGKRIAVVTGRGEWLEADFPSMTNQTLIAEERDAELLSYSPSGRYLVMYGTDSVQLWDTEEDGFATDPIPHPDTVTGVDFSKDEKMFVTSCWDQRARLFDAATSSTVVATVKHEAGVGSNLGRRVYVPAILVGNDRLCTLELVNEFGGYYKNLVISDLEGNELHRTKLIIRSMLLNDRDRYVITGTSRELTFTNVESFEQDKFEPADADYRVALHAKSNLLALCSSSNIELLTLDDLDKKDSSSCMNKLVNFCKFSPDGSLLCTSERGGLVKVWQRIDRNPGTYSVNVSNANSYAELSPDGKYFAAVGLSQRSSSLSDLMVFEVETGKPVFRRRTSVGRDRDGRMRRENRVFTDGKFLSNDAIAVAASITDRSRDRYKRAGKQSGLIEVWDRKAEEKRYAVKLENEPRSLDVSPDGRHIAALSADGTVTVLLSETGMIVDRWLAHPPALNNNWYSNNGEIAFGPDGQAIVTWGTASFARIWDFDPKGGQAFEGSPAARIPRIELGHQGRVLDLKFSPDGKMIATSEWDGDRVQVWDYATGERLGQPMKHPDWVMGIRFSPDGQQIASACRDRSVRLWDWRTGQLICPPMPHNDETHDAAFSPDGKTIVTTCYEGSVGIWEAKTGKRLTPAIATDSRGIRLTVTPDGSHAIVSGHVGEHGRRAISVVKLEQATQRDERPTEDIVAMAEFFAGHRIRSSTPEGLNNQELVALYDRAKGAIQWELGLAEFVPWENLKGEEIVALRLSLFDKNQDGHLNLTEAPPTIAMRFASLDSNSDGRLSDKELPTDVETYGYAFSNYSSPSSQQSRFDQIDWDNVDIAQWHPSFRQLVKHFDDDDDGRLSRAEVEHMLEEAPFLKNDLLLANRGVPWARGSERGSGRSQLVEGYGKKMLELFDADQDGRLGRTEATPRLLPRFESLDKDSDGQLAEDELELRVHASELDDIVQRTLERGGDWETRPLEARHPSLQQLVKHFDTDGDNHVSRVEVGEMVKQVPFLGIELRYASRPARTPTQLVEGFGKKMLEWFDVDQDGALSEAEATPFLARRFDSLDKDSDGRLVEDELVRRVGLGIRNPAFLEQLLDRYVDWDETSLEELHPSFQHLVKHFDTNGDSHISRNEAKAMLEEFPFLRIDVAMATFPAGGTGLSMSNGTAPRGGFRFGVRGRRGLMWREPTDADVQRILQLNDTNKDGKIGAVDHMGHPWGANFARYDKNSDGYLGPEEIRGAGIVPYSGKLLLETYDTNGDGVLTKDEAGRPALRSFEQLDADSSGTLSEQELDEVRGTISNGGRTSWSMSSQGRPGVERPGVQRQRNDPDFKPSVASPRFTKENSPTVAIDEGHRNYHTRDGRFLPLAQVLEADGCTVVGHDGPFTKESLVPIDVLVIANALPATATGEQIKSAFSHLEVELLKEWVNGGGSLMVLADHWPYGEAVKQLGAAFGVEMSGGFVLGSGERRGHIVFDRAEKLLAKHPITEGAAADERITAVMSFTGQAMRVPESFTALMSFPEGSVRYRDRPTASESEGTDVSGWHQGAVAEIGKGRVAFFGEAGMFSAQVTGAVKKMGMNADGAEQNEQFLLNIIHWLAD